MVYLAYATVDVEVRAYFVDHVEELADTNISNQSRNAWFGLVFRTLANVHNLFCLIRTAFSLGGVSRVGVGLTSLLTAPIPAVLLVYHVWLVSTGMTTNERRKWKAFRKTISEGDVYFAVIAENGQATAKSHNGWPKRSRAVFVCADHGLAPEKRPSEILDVLDRTLDWDRCNSIKEVENIYDLGAWRNWIEVLAH
jgi:hypothetical protein